MGAADPAGAGDGHGLGDDGCTGDDVERHRTARLTHGDGIGERNPLGVEYPPATGKVDENRHPPPLATSVAFGVTFIDSVAELFEPGALLMSLHE